MGPKGILFLQTHSSVETENKWIDNFKDKIYYSHGKTNSCGLLIAFYGNLNVCVKNKVNDNDDRVLILEATIDYLLINLYNANTEKEQLATIKNLNNLLKDFEDFYLLKSSSDYPVSDYQIIRNG